MTAPTPTPDQHVRDRITRDGLRHTLFVEAGAGTGKTTQLVGRVVNLVVDHGVRLAEIAAITFTDAAAAELRDRIRHELERRLATATEADVAARCREALADADLAAISTLHGFAQRILGEHPVAAGVPPRIEVLDELGSELERRTRWERFVDDLYATPAHEELLVRAALLGAALEPRYAGQVTLEQVAITLGQSWDRLDAVAADDPGPLPALDVSSFVAAVDDLAAVRSGCHQPDDKLHAAICDVLPRLEAVAALDDPHRQLRALVGLSVPKLGRAGRATAWDDVDHARRCAVAVTEAVAEILARAAHEVLTRLVVLVAREVRRAADARRVDGRLEFHDLLVLARQVLRDHPAARAALHRRYTTLLLDEFQDTDPIQIELAVLIAASIGASGDDPAGGPDLDWRAVPVDPGRLFFVGDPKQSIYRFRRADIELFLAARDHFGGEGLVSLTANFRTVPEVIAWVNHVFGRLMVDEVPGQQPRYEPLSAHRASADGGDHRPVLLGGPHQGLRAAELRAREADDVAAAIASVRDHPHRWLVHDDDGSGGRADGFRPARLSDVCVLVPTRTSLPDLTRALDARGLPYRLATGTLVYDTQEVRDALSALRAIDDPADELSLVAALRSPLYACADTDLFTYRTAGGRWDLRADPPDGLVADHPVVAALAHLRGLWAERWWIRPSELLDRLLVERRAAIVALGHGRPAEVWGRLRFLVDQARVFEASVGGGLRPFLDWTELQSSDTAQVHEPLLPELDDDAVRILTIHGAKGLEFPITVLSGMSTQLDRGRPGASVVWGADGRPQVRLTAGLAMAGHGDVVANEATLDRHERLRVLYVACTRARDHLVVSCHHTEGSDSYGGIVWTHAHETREAWRRLDELDDPVDAGAPAAAATGGPFEVTSGPVPIAPLDAARRAWMADRDALLAPHRTPRAVSATAVARAAVAHPSGPAGPDGVPTGLADLDTDLDTDLAAADLGPGAVTPRRRGRAGTAVGRAVHATLQVVDLADPVGLDTIAARAAAAEAVPELTPTVVALVRSALASDAVQLAVAHEHHREVYVAAPVGDRVLEGYVDLLVVTPDGLVVIDHKTDAVRSEAEVDAAVAAYELQGAAYAEALARTTGLPVVEVRFVFCRAGAPIERRVVDLDAARARVIAQLTAGPP
ncbi:MAG TPA: UvrD-helicase domain-containing protein [Acidimicrobiales bacterium]|nr:UvrD-helicase domain-containing protein [Acidimicrobiales bacterium]